MADTGESECLMSDNAGVEWWAASVSANGCKGVLLV